MASYSNFSYTLNQTSGLYNWNIYDASGTRTGYGNTSATEFQNLLTSLYKESTQASGQNTILGLEDTYYNLYGLDAAKALFGDTYTAPGTNQTTTSNGATTPTIDESIFNQNTGVQPIGYDSGAGLSTNVSGADTSAATGASDTSGISDVSNMVSNALNEIANGGGTSNLDNLAKMYNTSATNLYNTVQQELQKLNNTTNTLQAQANLQNQLATVGSGKSQTGFTAQNISQKMQEMATKAQQMKKLPKGTEQTKTGAALLNTSALLSKPTLLGL